MGHFAKVKDGKVIKVIVAEPEFFNNFVDDEPGQWIKTSYNIRGGVYLEPNTNTPASDQSVINDDEGRQRKNYAGIGFTYDKTRDAFIPPQPFDSWTLNETTCLWDPPISKPANGNDFIYKWDENLYQSDTSDPKTLGWVKVMITE